MATAVFGAGCFWGVEAAFRLIPGVVATEVGFMGGHLPNPTSQQVGRGNTGHAEVVRVEFDPERVTYEELLNSFWKIHDPTQRDGQGPHIGPSYRSVIFVNGDEQKQTAAESRMAQDRSGRHHAPIATEILPIGEFWRAEERHQQYFEKRGLALACAR